MGADQSKTESALSDPATIRKRKEIVKNDNEIRFWLISFKCYFINYKL